MRRQAVFGLVALVTIALFTIGATRTTQVYTEGKEIADSLAATADTMTALVIPAGVDSVRVFIAADSSVVYTIQISPDASKWYSVVADSNAASGSDHHAIANVYPPGWYVRAIFDNKTATTSYAKTAVSWEY